MERSTEPFGLSSGSKNHAEGRPKGSTERKGKVTKIPNTRTLGQTFIQMPCSISSFDVIYSIFTTVKDAIPSLG